MFPGSTNSPLFHPPTGPAPAMRSALTQLWHCGTSECQGEHMCIKAGAKAAEPQSRNLSKTQSHRTATRRELAAWPSWGDPVLQHLRACDVLLKSGRWAWTQSPWWGSQVRKWDVRTRPAWKGIRSQRNRRTEAMLLLFGCQGTGKNPPLDQMVESVERGP